MSNSTVFTSDDIRNLSRTVSNLMQQLRGQRDILRQRGMDLPPGTIQGLEDIHVQLEKVAPKVSEQSSELEQLRTLRGIAGVINSSLDMEESVRVIMDTVIEISGAERGYIMLKNPETGELEISFARGMDEKDLGSDGHSVSNTIVSEVVETGEPLVTTNAQHDTRFAGQQSIVGLSLRSILCVPIILKGEIMGVVYVDNRIKDGMFGNKELQLLVAVAAQAAFAIENARLFEQARATLEEITQIKTLLDNILASIASGVITTDGNDLVTTFNRSASEILESLPDDVLGQQFYSAVPSIYDKVHETLADVRATGAYLTVEADTSINSRELSLTLKLSPLKNAYNETQGVALVVDDLTELKKRDKMLDAIRRYLPPAMVDNIQSIDKIGLAGERRVITALFVEVRPLDTFPSDLQVNELMEVLNIYMTAGTEAIHRRLGVVDKYMGSEIMALFNTQLNPSDDHAWDAVQAAIDMVFDFHDLYARLGENPSVPYYRIGIHTGDATLGNVGGTARREFSAIGDTVNLAKRLQENATSGQLIISASTLDACREEIKEIPDIEVLEREPLYVKGRKQAAQVFEVRLSAKG